MQGRICATACTVHKQTSYGPLQTGNKSVVRNVRTPAKKKRRNPVEFYVQVNSTQSSISFRFRFECRKKWTLYTNGQKSKERKTSHSEVGEMNVGGGLNHQCKEEAVKNMNLPIYSAHERAAISTVEPIRRDSRERNCAQS
jgi:hypothetical protein